MDTPFLRRLAGRSAHIGVVGLGYVGIATVGQLLTEGHRVTAFERDPEQRARIAEGPWPFPDDAGELERIVRDALADERLVLPATEASPGPAGVQPCDVWVLCTETPAPRGTFDDAPLEAALTRTVAGLAPEALVVVQSTLPAGTMARTIVPRFRDAASKVHLAYAPVRVMPGRLLENTRTLRRVVGVGAGDEQSTTVAAMRQLFAATEEHLDFVDFTTAELVKLAENAYRDAQIALANEMALVCEQAKGDFWRVRELVNAVPGRALAMPGPGVGGACLPKDTWLLVGSGAAGEATHETTPPSLLRAARERNDAMPRHVANALLRRLADVPHPVVAVLGLTYRENTSVLRDSPAGAVVDILRDAGGDRLTLRLHDPTAAPGELSDVVDGADAILLLVRHDAYRELDLRALRGAMRSPLLFDACGAMSPEATTAAGFELAGLGRP